MIFEVEYFIDMDLIEEKRFRVEIEADSAEEARKLMGDLLKSISVFPFVNCGIESIEACI